MEQEFVQVPIKPRDMRFKFEDALATDWNGGDVFRTAFFNAMSILFPYGEKSFIDSVRGLEHKVTDPALKERVKGFMAQEFIHRREHKRFNETLCAQRTYDLDDLEGPVRKGMEQVGGLDPVFWLATTVAYEHLTSTIANCLLTEESWLAGAHPAIAKVWRWHAIEEIEHKSVAFDVYMAAGGTHAQLRRAMMLVSFEFLVTLMGRNLLYIFRKDRPPLGKLLKSAWGFLFGRRGFFRANWSHYWAFFRRNFHPDHIDDRQTLERAIAAEGFTY